MTPNSDWWDRAKTPPRPQPIEIRKRERLCTLRKGEHEITLEWRPVFGVGEELILSVNEHWRRMRVFKQNALGMLTASVAATVSSLEAKGWQVAAAVLLVVVVASCSSRPAALDVSAPVVTVCRAAVQPVGSRIAVRGEFSGTDYSSQPTTITLASDDTCNASGAGLVFAEVWHRDEMVKIADAVPRGKRRPTPGTVLTIEGDISKVDQGRFVILMNAIVR